MGNKNQKEKNTNDNDGTPIIKFYKGSEKDFRLLRTRYMFDATTEIVGQGRYGKVYRTSHVDDQSLTVAIKVINKYKMPL